MHKEIHLWLGRHRGAIIPVDHCAGSARLNGGITQDNTIAQHHAITKHDAITEYDTVSKNHAIAKDNALGIVDLIRGY